MSPSSRNEIAMLRELLIFAICLMLQAGFCQNRGNIWYFGLRAGLDFNSGAPVPLLDGQLITTEGVATMCATDGSLLFYTDGTTVWDRSHSVMQNGTGLLGHSSSSQSAIVVPKPGSATVYYIFTVGSSLTLTGFNYSEVNMALNGGLGAITAKNTPLLAQCTEQVAATRHANGTDLWVVTHLRNNNTFQAFRITPAGVAATPVASSAGLSVGNNTNDMIGCIKIAPNGARLASTHYSAGAQVAAFDNATGIVSDARVLDIDMFYYGTEFSPSGKLLYVCKADSGRLTQYNLEVGDIPGSEIEIFAGLGLPVGSFQLGPDGRIYSTRGNAMELDVINSPDSLGTACNYVLDAIDLGGRMPTFGLPALMEPYNSITIQTENFCLGDATSFTLNSQFMPHTAVWDFGDGQTATGATATHTYATAGNYTVSVTLTTGMATRLASKTITILPQPVATRPNDLVSCSDGSSALFGLRQQDEAIRGGQPPGFAISYHLTPQDAETGTNALPDDFMSTANPQTIFARVTAPSGCHAETSFLLMIQPLPVIALPDTLVFCAGENMTLTAPEGFDGYSWSTGQDTQAITVAATGDYTLTVRRSYGTAFCEASTTINVTVLQPASIESLEIADWTNDRNTITVHAAGLDIQYSTDGRNWQDDPVLQDLAPGRYTVYARNDCGSNQREAVLLMYPRFFTPNGDGINDTWRIDFGFFEPGFTVNVLDRYGRLLKSFAGSDPGWDGTLNGSRLPATDYWFVVQRQDGRIHKGHFSLLR